MSRDVPRFGGAVAVVSGASSGIGRHLAVTFARQGATVVGLARRQQLLDEVAGELRRHTPDSDTVRCDVSHVDDYRETLSRLEEQHGRIDLLVNAAGVERRAAATDVDLDAYRGTFETNFFAAVAGTLRVLPGMLERGTGYVVNVSSDQGRAPTPETSAYSASKAALAAFTESVAHEVRGTGVHLHVLYPGWVPTPMGQGALARGMAEPPRAVRRTVEDVARAVLSSLGNGRVDIDVAKAGALATAMKIVAPRLYHAQLSRR